MNNYICINGEKIELTNEQLKLLGLYSKKDSFSRVKKGEIFFCINDFGEVDCKKENFDDYKEALYNNANYCKDEEILIQRALQEKLNRKLWRFSCENGELENPWNEENEHFYINYDCSHAKFLVDSHNIYKGNEIYFSTPKIAFEAIEKIVKPFIKENPSFKW